MKFLTVLFAALVLSMGSALACDSSGSGEDCPSPDDRPDGGNFCAPMGDGICCSTNGSGCSGSWFNAIPEIDKPRVRPDLLEPVADLPPSN